jgi:hypothetical protein
MFSEPVGSQGLMYLTIDRVQLRLQRRDHGQQRVDLERACCASCSGRRPSATPPSSAQETSSTATQRQCWQPLQGY